MQAPCLAGDGVHLELKKKNPPTFDRNSINPLKETLQFESSVLISSLNIGENKF